MNRWKKIDSAPRTGKVLLLWNGDIFMLGYYIHGWQEWGVPLPIAEERLPTHWMELPAPPPNVETAE